MKNQINQFTFCLIVIFASCNEAFAAESIEPPVNPETALSDLSDLMKVKWPKNRTINIVCHGHSVPAGYFKTPTVDTFNAYPHLLHKALKKRYPHAVINVIVTAIGGERSDQGTKRFAKDVLTHNPDLILIDYALNDRRIGLKKAQASWESMIMAAKKRNIKLILLTPTTDVRSKLNDPKDPLNQHAKQIRNLAKEHNLPLVDSMQALKKKIQSGTDIKKLMSSVNHPNRKGHDIVVQEIMKWFPE